MLSAVKTLKLRLIYTSILGSRTVRVQRHFRPIDFECRALSEGSKKGAYFQFSLMSISSQILCLTTCSMRPLNSNKQSNVRFCEEITKGESIEVQFMHLMLWNSIARENRQYCTWSAPVVQWIMHWTTNPGVAGAISPLHQSFR